jgi:RNA polymerase sigma-70 factor (ECF subfamily)
VSWAAATGGDVGSLQGAWRAVEVTADGRRAPDGEATMFRVAVAGNKLTLSAGGDDHTARFTLDPTRSPRAIDLTWLDGSEKGRTVRGIYAREGGRLRLCVPNPKAGDGEGRPGGFTAAAGEGRMLFTLEKVPQK